MVNFHTSFCIDQSKDGYSQGFAPVGCSIPLYAQAAGKLFRHRRT
jgi:hypothetical protein